MIEVARRYLDDGFEKLVSLTGDLSEPGWIVHQDGTRRPTNVSCAAVLRGYGWVHGSPDDAVADLWTEPRRA